MTDPSHTRLCIHMGSVVFGELLLTEMYNSWMGVLEQVPFGYIVWTDVLHTLLVREITNRTYFS